MAFQPVGTQVLQETIFNSGLITFGSDQFIDITDITAAQGFTEKSFRALNSIFKRANKRATYEAMLSFTAHTNAKAFQDLFYSASSVVSATETVYNVNDGQQQNVPTILVTLYTNDAKTTGYQFEIESPVITKMDTGLSTEDFGAFECEVACIKFANIRRITA